MAACHTASQPSATLSGVALPRPSAPCPAAVAEPPTPSPPLVPQVATDAVDGPASNAPATDELSDVLSDRRVFRSLMAGMLPPHATRLTWVLTRSVTRARMRLYNQTGAWGMRRLDGNENDESVWSAPCVTLYEGTPDGTLSYNFSRSSPPATGAHADKESRQTDCEWMPAAFTLQCRKEGVRVQHAGAVLLTGACENLWKGWAPATTERVQALRCDVLPPGETAPFPHHDDGCSHGDGHFRDNPLINYFSDGSIVFAAAGPNGPGIEWVFENSDCLVQEGGFRLMSMPR
jgi:hypothetical protein